MALTDKKCMPCEGGTLPLTEAQIKEYRTQLKTNWIVFDGKKIQQKFKFKNFKEAVTFVNKVAELADQEGHHPDIRIFGYNKVEIDLLTHTIGGLSENDFILASKIEKII